MYNIFAQLIKSRGIKTADVSRATGIAKSTLSEWKSGKSTPKLDKIKKIAEFLEVPYTVLLDDPDGYVSSGTQIPLLGSVIAGVPIQAIEEIIGYEEITPKLSSTGEHFALKIKGDSMAPRILEGDVIIVRKQASADSNDIVVVCVNGDTATCKKLIKHKDGISLVSFNVNYPPMYFSSEDIEAKPVVIIGKVVEFRGRF